MKNVLQNNAPLPYPHLISNFFDLFDIPLDDEPFVMNKSTFKIGVEVINSFVLSRTMIVSGFINVTTLNLFLMREHCLHHLNIRILPLLL